MAGSDRGVGPCSPPWAARSLSRNIDSDGWPGRFWMVDSDGSLPAHPRPGQSPGGAWQALLCQYDSRHCYASRVRIHGPAPPFPIERRACTGSRWRILSLLRSSNVAASNVAHGCIWTHKCDKFVFNQSFSRFRLTLTYHIFYHMKEDSSQS